MDPGPDFLAADADYRFYPWFEGRACWNWIIQHSFLVAGCILYRSIGRMVSGKQIGQVQAVVCTLLFFHHESLCIPRVYTIPETFSIRKLGTGKTG
jgi:hypothetical protein